MPEWQASAALHDLDRQRRARALAQPQPQRQQRRLAQPLQQPPHGRPRPRHGRPGNGPARPGPRGCQHRGGGGADEAVQDHRDAQRPAPAAIAPAIAASSRPPRHASATSGSALAPGLAASPASTTAILRASPASSTPVPRPTQSAAAPPIERQRQRRRRGGVADPHLAGDQQVGRRHRPRPSRPSAGRTASASVIAGPSVKSAVGRSRSSATTSHPRPGQRRAAG